MGVSGDCACSEEQVNLMFKRAEQFIDDQIADRTYNMSRYWVDLYPVKPFPDGAGLTLDKVRFYGDIGPQYDGFDGWRKLQISNSGGLGGDNDGCAYKWEDVGHGMETVSYDLMQRDLRTKPICVKDIRTFFQYQETQNLIFQNLANISANMREQLNRNATMRLAIKHVALPGLPFNTANPHQLPVIPAGVEVGRLTYRLLLQMYHPLAQEAGNYSLATIDGMPSFGVVAHPETLQDMVYEDPEIRKDLRECDDTACSLIKRYNFLDSIGPFILMPDLFAPRYDRDAAGVLSRIFPYDRSLPIEFGQRPITNEAYHSAEFELVLILTRDLFSLRTRRPITSVGGATNFDSEAGMFLWKWHNPERCEDPYRRVGRYVSTAEIGVEPGDFTDTSAILVKRKPGYAGIDFWPVEVCPPDPVVCDNILPLECPCPQIVGVCDAIDPQELLVTFDKVTGAVALDVIELVTVNGSFVSVTVTTVSADGLSLLVNFGVDVHVEPGFLVELRCLDVSFCSSEVIKTGLCGIVGNTVDLILCRLIKATVADTITLNFCNGEQQDVPITVADTAALTYTVTLAYADYCANGGVKSVCVPTATDASCPDCDASVYEDCVPVE